MSKIKSIKYKIAALVYWPPSRITFETAAAAAISRPWTRVVSGLLVALLSHFTGLAKGLFWNFSKSIVAWWLWKINGVKNLSQGEKLFSWRHAKEKASLFNKRKCVTTCDFERESDFSSFSVIMKNWSRRERKENASFSRLKKDFSSSLII